MIVELVVKNFRSIKDEQIISTYTTDKLTRHPENVAVMEGDVSPLKTCAFFGANASGKTNLIRALETLKQLITESDSWREGDNIPCYEPYLLDREMGNAPTFLEIEFFVKGTRYNYQIEFGKKEILSEKLNFFPNTRVANLFTRSSSSDWKNVKFGDYYKGGRKQFAFFANNSYLSKAGSSADSPEIAREVFNYFRQNIQTMINNELLRVLDQGETYKEIISEFLRKADFGISTFEMENIPNAPSIQFPEEIPETIRDKLVSSLFKRPVFFHETNDGEHIKFDEKKESMGTLRLFKLLPVFLTIIENGHTLFIDEIENSLHPHLAELVIKLFNDATVNKNNAQLFFTTHNLSLMSPNLLRRDQIYLVHKEGNRGSIFDCLRDYDEKLKDVSPFAKWYDEGRLGAIPEINYQDIARAISGAF